MTATSKGKSSREDSMPLYLLPNGSCQAVFYILPFSEDNLPFRRFRRVHYWLGLSSCKTTLRHLMHLKPQRLQPEELKLEGSFWSWSTEYCRP